MNSFRGIKRNVGSNLQMKIDKLKSKLVLIFDNSTEKKSYSAIVREKTRIYMFLLCVKLNPNSINFKVFFM